MQYLQTCETSDLGLVAALATCGIKPDPVRPCRLFQHPNGSESYLFRFEAGHPDNGKEGVAPVFTVDLMQHWNDPQWLAEHPRHPLTYCKYMQENRQQLLTSVKERAPFAVVEHQGKHAFVPLGASQAKQDVILSELERPTL